MTPFTITPSTGSPVSFSIYTIPNRARAYAANAFTPRWTSDAVRVDGDLLELPSGYAVRAFVNEAAFATAYATAYSAIATARLATEVETYEGVKDVDGLLDARIEVEGMHLFVTFTFAPTAPGYQP